MSKYLYNTTEVEKTYLGKIIAAESYYLIPTNLELPLAQESTLLVDVANAEIIVSKIDNSSGHITNINSAIDYLKDNLPSQVESLAQPFASKILSNGSRLFRRVHGITASVQNAPDNIDFTVPYAKCKITGVQILNGKIGDKANFKVLDTAGGLISGVPNAVLNQFGFDVNIIPDEATYPSKYDADLIAGMVLRIEYDAVDELLPRTIYVNLDLHQVVD